MKRNQNRVLDTRTMVLVAALIALHIVLSRYLGIQVSPSLRLGVESIPIALAGMWLGPLPGALVALLSDFLGTVILGHGAWFPPIALGPMFVAAACGCGVRYLFRRPLTEPKDAWKIIAMTVVVGLINELLVGTVTTTLYQMLIIGKDGTFGVLAWANFLARVTTKPWFIAACSGMIALIHRSVYRPVISRIVRRAV